VIEMRPLPLVGGSAVGITVDLPRTRLVVAAVPAGYIMCGALDVALLDRLLGSRRIVAGRALGVRTLDDLLVRPLESVTDAARAAGLHEGMAGAEALQRLLALEPQAVSPGSPASRP
jgi:uncharacterized protein YunC (DUF1805 family)